MTEELEQIHIRKMTAADVRRVHELECACFITPWSYKSLAAEIDNSLAYYAVALCNEIIVGYVGMWRIFEEAHITNVAVDADYRRRGIGEMLMRHILKTAGAAGAQMLTLEVRESNCGAQRLYARLGFTQCGRRRKYYSDTGEDALLLVVSLAPSEQIP